MSAGAAAPQGVNVWQEPLIVLPDAVYAGRLMVTFSPGSSYVLVATEIVEVAYDGRAFPVHWHCRPTTPRSEMQQQLTDGFDDLVGLVASLEEPF